jgi:hypothetical protein
LRVATKVCALAIGAPVAPPYASRRHALRLAVPCRILRPTTSNRKPTMSRFPLVLHALAPLLLVAAAAAQAQTVVPPVSGTPIPGTTGKTGNFAAEKQKALTHIQERLQRLNSEQSCVSAAQDVNALKVCREQAQGPHERRC